MSPISDTFRTAHRAAQIAEGSPVFFGIPVRAKHALQANAAAENRRSLFSLISVVLQFVLRVAGQHVNKSSNGGKKPYFLSGMRTRGKNQYQQTRTRFSAPLHSFSVTKIVWNGSMNSIQTAISRSERSTASPSSSWSCIRTRRRH